MIITCEACGTSFKLKTSLVKETGSTVRCSKCQRVFIAYPTSTGREKSSAFKLDESLESKIDDMLGEESDDGFDDIESEISLDTAEISMTASDDKLPGGTFEDEFSDFESEMSTETAEVSMATSEDLFDSTTSLLDALDEGEEEPEIMMSALLQDDEEVLSMDDLVSGKTAEPLDMNDLLADDDGGDADILSFDDLESNPTEKDDDLGALLEAEDESDIVSFDDMEKPEDAVTFDAIEEEPAQEEEIVVFDDVESEEAFEQTVEEAPKEEEQIDFMDFEDSTDDGKTLPEQITVETKGGVSADLDEFDVKKEPKKEKAEKPEEDLDFDLDFDLEEEAPVSDQKKADASEDEFEMDLDLDIEDKKADASTPAADEEDFDLDFDLDADETLVVSEKKVAKATDLELDLDGFEDLDLTETESVKSMEEDLGLDEFDDMDLGEEPEKQSTGAEAEKDDFDLDFDLDTDMPVEAADKGADEADEFNFDLDIEPEAVEAKVEKGDAEDFELDFDDTFEDKTVTVSETLLDEAPAGKSEELDLTQIEDVLDFDFDESPKQEKAKTAAATKGGEPTRLELEEPELYTASDDDDMNIDLETMLDEEESAHRDKKEVALETVEQREKQEESQYRKTIIEEEPAPAQEKFSTDLSREFEEEYTAAPVMPAMMARKGEEPKGRNLKKILVGLLILILLGVLGFFGWKMFGGKETPPPAVTDQTKGEVKDLGNLQMEMISTPEYQFITNKTSGEILVINGTVTNRYDHPRSNVQVKGTLYNNAGKVIISSVVYCGNMFTAAELTDLDIAAIEGRLGNRMGDNQINSSIMPGMSVPFTVVFKNLPQDMDEFTAEVAASVK
jgi:predicted Zn finger-like uncharacterized protein